MLSAFRFVFSPKFHQFPEYLNRLFVQCLLTTLQLYTACTRIWLGCSLFNLDFTYSRSSHHNQIISKYMSFLMIMTRSEKFYYRANRPLKSQNFKSLNQVQMRLIFEEQRKSTEKEYGMVPFNLQLNALTKLNQI